MVYGTQKLENLAPGVRAENAVSAITLAQAEVGIGKPITVDANRNRRGFPMTRTTVNQAANGKRGGSANEATTQMLYQDTTGRSREEAAMSIRDIIEWLAEDMDGCDKDYGRGCALHCDIARISAEVALMEAVCEAVGRCGSGLVMDAPHEWRTVAEAYDALQAYRKERGTACNATTPANPTDQVAATTATRGDIASHEGDATIPAVVQDAQQYGHDEARLALHLLDRVWRGKDVDVPDDYDPEVVVAAYIERLEAEYPCKGVMDCGRCEHRIPPDDCSVLIINARHKAERDALLAEHEAAKETPSERLHLSMTRMRVERIRLAHDNAERVIHGE